MNLPIEKINPIYNIKLDQNVVLDEVLDEYGNPKKATYKIEHNHRIKRTLIIEEKNVDNEPKFSEVTISCCKPYITIKSVDGPKKFEVAFYAKAIELEYLGDN